jgi:hypothetical protein
MIVVRLAGNPSGGWRRSELLFEIQRQLLKTLFGERVKGLVRQATALRKTPFQLCSVALCGGHATTLPQLIVRGTGAFVQSELNFWLVGERGDLARAMPEFHVVTIGKLFCFFRGLGIVLAMQCH